MGDKITIASCSLLISMDAIGSKSFHRQFSTCIDTSLIIQSDGGQAHVPATLFDDVSYLSNPRDTCLGSLHGCNQYDLGIGKGFHQLLARKPD